VSLSWIIWSWDFSEGSIVIWSESFGSSFRRTSMTLHINFPPTE
jgi:hypothetical protein